MNYQDPGLPDDEPVTTCPDCRGVCSLLVVDIPHRLPIRSYSLPQLVALGKPRWVNCSRCESTGEINGKDAREVLAEKDEAAREREAEHASNK